MSDIEQSKPNRHSGETADEIATWYGYNHKDAVAGMSQEIHMLSAEVHKLTGARLQQIEINKLLLPMIDILSEDIEESSANTRFRIGEIKKFIQAGAKG